MIFRAYNREVKYSYVLFLIDCYYESNYLSTGLGLSADHVVTTDFSSLISLLRR